MESPVSAVERAARAVCDGRRWISSRCPRGPDAHRQRPLLPGRRRCKSAAPVAPALTLQRPGGPGRRPCDGTLERRGLRRGRPRLPGDRGVGLRALLRRVLEGARAFPPPLAGNLASFGDSPERQMRQASGSGSAESLALLRDLKTQLLIS